MGDEIYDYLDKLPAAPRVDILDSDLALLERAASAIGAARVEVAYGEGYVNCTLPTNLSYTHGTYCFSAVMRLN